MRKTGKRGNSAFSTPAGCVESARSGDDVEHPAAPVTVLVEFAAESATVAAVIA